MPGRSSVVKGASTPFSRTETTRPSERDVKRAARFGFASTSTFTNRARGSSSATAESSGAAVRSSGLASDSRGRVFVVVGLIAGVVLYGGVISAMGIF